MSFGLTKQVLNESTLTNSFDRRSFVLGVGGLSVGILLAARMGYLAIAECMQQRLSYEPNSTGRGCSRRFSRS